MISFVRLDTFLVSVTDYVIGRIQRRFGVNCLAYIQAGSVILAGLSLFVLATSAIIVDIETRSVIVRTFIDAGAFGFAVLMIERMVRYKCSPAWADARAVWSDSLKERYRSTGTRVREQMRRPRLAIIFFDLVLLIVLTKEFSFDACIALATGLAFTLAFYAECAAPVGD